MLFLFAFYQNQLFLHNLSDGERILQFPLDVGTITGCSGRRKDEEVPLLLIANEIF